MFCRCTDKNKEISKKIYTIKQGLRRLITRQSLFTQARSEIIVIIVVVIIFLILLLVLLLVLILVVVLVLVLILIVFVVKVVVHDAHSFLQTLFCPLFIILY